MNILIQTNSELLTVKYWLHRYLLLESFPYHQIELQFQPNTASVWRAAMQYVLVPVPQKPSPIKSVLFKVHFSHGHAQDFLGLCKGHYKSIKRAFPASNGHFQQDTIQGDVDDDGVYSTQKYSRSPMHNGFVPCLLWGVYNLNSIYFYNCSALQQLYSTLKF